ncbi:MAG TPA: DUF1853 family protein [Moraxellaceae bacterium]|nr:DUF1853 family protein [Moraxellaceae bacterium]
MAGIDESAWRRWRHALVRDLAWSLASPPLLAAPVPGLLWLDQEWGRRALAASEDWLAALDRDPSPLASALSRRPGRLGSYFESLLDAWLDWPGNPLYRRLYHGLPVRQGKRTVGEFDFLVEERATGEVQHWEVAVKFYLGIAPGGDARHWVGPGLKDRLDLKIDRLASHQLPLAVQPEARALLAALGLPPPRPAGLLRGRLFYPAHACPAEWAPAGAARGHLRGWWMNATDFLRTFPDPGLTWIRLPREHWLAPVDLSPGSDGVSIGEPQAAAALVEAWQAAADNRAAAVVGLAQGREVTRGFITPPPWPRTLDPE